MLTDIRPSHEETESSNSGTFGPTSLPATTQADDMLADIRPSHEETESSNSGTFGQTSLPATTQAELEDQGNFSSSGMMSFADITNQSNWASSLEKNDNFKFQGTGTQLFSSHQDDGDVAEKQGEEPDVYFQPVVTLPDNYTYQSGDDGGTILFEHRCKLFRFHESLKQWKERGVGDIKITRHGQTGKARVIMRRDQIWKICCNHFITKDMKLVPLGNEKTWVWFTQSDYSDEEPKKEKLAVRFKTADTAKEFKGVFESCVEEVPSQDATSGGGRGRGRGKATSAQATGPLALQCSESEWECEDCMVRNKVSDTICIACTAPRQGLDLTGKDSTEQS